MFVTATSPPACPAAAILEPSRGGGGGRGLEGGRERCDDPFVLLAAGDRDGGGGIDFFRTEGCRREYVEDEMAGGAVADPVMEEDATDVLGGGDAVTDFMSELLLCCNLEDWRSDSSVITAGFVGVLGRSSLLDA